MAAFESDFQGEKVLAKARSGFSEVGINGAGRRKVLGQFNLPGGALTPELPNVGNRLASCSYLFEERHTFGVPSESNEKFPGLQKKSEGGSTARIREEPRPD